MDIDAEFRAWIAPMLIPPPELPDGMYYNSEMRPAVYCCVCERLFEWPVDVADYHPDDAGSHFCGGSPRCCP